MNRIQAILADVDGGEGSSSSQQQQPEAPGSPPDDESRVEGIEGLVRSELGGEGLRNFPGISVLDERRRQRESGGAEEGPTATNSALMLSKEEEVKRLTKQMDVLWMQDTERNLPQTKPFTVSGNASNSDSRGGSRAGGSRGGAAKEGERPGTGATRGREWFEEHRKKEGEHKARIKSKMGGGAPRNDLTTITGIKRNLTTYELTKQKTIEKAFGRRTKKI